MKTKEEALEEYMIGRSDVYSLRQCGFRAGWDAATQQLEAQRGKHVKTNIQILSKATGLSIEELELKNEVQCVRPSEALEAITANHDQEIMEFIKWFLTQYYGSWESPEDLLTKFRQQK